MPTSGLSQPHPYCCWSNPDFYIAIFISAATVATLDVSLPATLDVSLPSSLPHSSLQPMLCYLLSATYALRSLCCCHCSAATALLALLLCLSFAAFCPFSASSLLLLVESAFRYRALHFCRNCRYAGCELALFSAALYSPTYAVLPMLCYLCSSAFMLLPLLSCYCAASAAVLPLLCRLLAFLSPLLIASV